MRNILRGGAVLTLASVAALVLTLLRRETRGTRSGLMPNIPDSPLFPEQGSEIARSVDHLMLFALGGLVVFSALIAVLVLVFMVKYRRRHDGEVGIDVYETNPKSHVLELVWSVIPLGLLLVLFGWGTKVFFEQNRPPAGAVAVLGHGPAVDVEDPAPERPPRDQRAPRARRAGRPAAG